MLERARAIHLGLCASLTIETLEHYRLEWFMIKMKFLPKTQERMKVVHHLRSVITLKGYLL